MGVTNGNGYTLTIKRKGRYKGYDERTI
jgi:hypothetical protein